MARQTDGANWRISSNVRSALARIRSNTAVPMVSQPFGERRAQQVSRSSPPRTLSAIIAGVTPIDGARHERDKRHAAGAAEQVNRAGAGHARQPQHDHADDTVRAELPAPIDTIAG